MTANNTMLLGRYAILFKSYQTQINKSLSLKTVDKGFKKRRLKLKTAAETLLARRDTDSEKLIEITEGSQDCLITAKTLWPFNLFPDTISIDKQKLTIVHRSFFSTSSTISVQIDDVQIAKVDVGPFFGSVHLASKFFVDNIQSINFLRRSDAISIQRLLQGFIIAHHRRIDCSNIEQEQLVVLLNDLGQGNIA
jgi:hypothetical protein